MWRCSIVLPPHLSLVSRGTFSKWSFNSFSKRSQYEGAVICPQWIVVHRSDFPLFRTIHLLNISVESYFVLPHVDYHVTKGVNSLYWWYNQGEIEPYPWITCNRKLWLFFQPFTKLYTVGMILKIEAASLPNTTWCYNPEDTDLNPSKNCFTFWMW